MNNNNNIAGLPNSSLVDYYAYYFTSNNSLNLSSAKLEDLEKQSTESAARIYSSDTTMRKFGFFAEIVLCQLEYVKELQSQLALNPPQDDDQINEQLRGRIKEVKEGEMSSFKEVMKARDNACEGGEIVPLTPEKKKELLENFEKNLDTRIEERNINLTSSTDLEKLKEKLTNDAQSFLNIHDNILASKEPTTLSMLKTATAIESIKQTKKPQLKPKDIFTACEEGDSALLLEEIKKIPSKKRSVQLSVKDEKNHLTPLHIAVMNNRSECVKILLENGVNVTIGDELDGYWPIHWAAKLGNNDIVKMLVKKDPKCVNAKSHVGRTPLHMAIYNLKRTVMEFLLENKADINAQCNDEGQKITLLHEALGLQDSLQANLFTSILIKEKKLNVNLTDSQNQSPLYYAIVDGRADIATMIRGHISWKNSADIKDKNSLIYLARVKPRENEEEIRKFFANAGIEMPKNPL